MLEESRGPAKIPCKYPPNPVCNRVFYSYLDDSFIVYEVARQIAYLNEQESKKRESDSVLLALNGSSTAQQRCIYFTCFHNT